MKLSPLQQEFYDLIVQSAEEDLAGTIETEEEWTWFYEALVLDIKSMNAAELRHNIKVFTESV